MSLLRILFCVSTGALAALTPHAATAAPKQLFGKSIVVSWTEQREQRQTGWNEFRQVTIAGKFSAYVSTQGQLFNRISMTNRRGASGNVERVGSGGSGGHANISFQANSMIAIQANEGGARRIVVTFDPAFATCTAEVIRGKQEGAAVIRTGSIIYPGMKIEIRSVHTTGIGCTMSDGNIFAGQ
jgi:hypothetical protein